jgi:hypothetical protein
VRLSPYPLSTSSAHVAARPVVRLGSAPNAPINPPTTPPGPLGADHYTALYDGIAEKTRRAISGLIGPDQNAQILAPVPSHTYSAGVYALWHDNDGDALEHRLSKTLSTLLNAHGFSYQKATSPDDVVPPQDPSHPGWLSDGPWHVTINNLIFGQKAEPAAFQEAPALKKSLRTQPPGTLILSGIHLMPNMDLIATFLPDAAAEHTRASLRTGVFSAPEFQYPQFFHSTLGRLAPGTRVTAQDAPRLLALQKDLEQFNTVLRHAAGAPRLPLNQVTILHNEYSRGLYGRRLNSTWNAPEPQPVKLRG